MKKLVIVRPERVDVPGMSKYSYPSAGGMLTQVVAYNRTLGDFLREQLWLISGTQEQVDAFIAHQGISMVESWEEANKLTQAWNPSREMMNDPEAVIKAVEVLIKSLKGEGKPVPASLDPDDPTPGIVKQKFNLLDYVKPETLS